MQPPFALTIEQLGDTAVITLAGEFDTTRCSEVADGVAAHMSDGCVHLIINAADLSFCDSMGLRTILDFMNRADKAGGWLRLAGVQGVLQRLLEVTGVSQVIPVDPDVPTALQSRIS
ncbi:STAS domain-containing protein [Nonomuraea sp. SBT364]|uniref:STAS domain-containing protein n=1 Tax=Nonomuraea sp. SBT364 TaxID=1580530 RepID=UPI00066A5BA8|nr:STAS domain-containing protein [Nonomuraea sp. SBT364]